MCFAAYVSTRNFTCLREISFFLIGWTLVERWRNLIVSSKIQPIRKTAIPIDTSPARFFERQQQNSASKKDGHPHQHVTGTYRHVIEKHCRTDNQYENSCNPWLNHGWLWSHRSTRNCTSQRIFTVLRLCGGAVEIGETEFASRRFLRVRWSSV